MSVIDDVTTAVADIVESRDRIVADADKLVALIEGPASGAGSTVDLGGDAGEVNTPAKVLTDAEQALLSQWPSPITITLDFDDATADADPTDGKFRLGSASQNAAVAVRLSETDVFGNSTVGRLTLAAISTNATKGLVAIIKYGDRSKYIVTSYSALADAGAYRNVTIAAANPNGEASATSPFVPGDRCLLIFLPIGNKGANGADGAGSGDMQSDDTPTTTLDLILGWSSTDKHAKGKSFAALLAGAGHTAVQKAFGPWSGVTLAGTCDISATNTVFAKITAGAGPITSFGTTRDGWLRIVRADVGFTITRDATNLETPNQSDAVVAAGSILIVARESSETAGKTQVLHIIPPDGRAFRGPNDIPQNLSLSGVISPSQITSNQNDYAPTGHQTAFTERLNSDAARTLTGLAAPTSGRAEVRMIYNVGSFGITISDADASSTAANRFAFGANFVIAAGKGVMIWYDTTSSRWRPMSQLLSWGALATLDRVTNIDQDFSLSGDISPTQLSANTNDWAPTGFSTASVIRASTDASRNLTGIGAPSTKRIIKIFNIGSNNLVLKNEDSNSTAANRFSFGGDRTLAGGDGLELWYDTTSARWRATAIISTGGGGGGGTTAFGVVNGRLTLVTATPVMTTSQTAKTTIFWSPINGGQIGLYDGVSAWSLITATEKSINLTDTQTGTTTNGSAVMTGLADTSQMVVGSVVNGTGVVSGQTILSVDGGTQITLSANATASGSNSMTFKLPASNMYDVFGYNNAGALKLEIVKWTNTTTRATALTTQDGVLVKTGATTRRYLGSFATTATAGQTEYSFGGSASGGTAANLLLYNYYNRKDVDALVQDGASTWSYATGTLRSANNSNGNRVNFVVGVSEDIVRATYAAGVQMGASSTNPGIAIGLDSTSAASGIKSTKYGAIANSYSGAVQYFVDSGVTTTAAASGVLSSGLQAGGVLHAVYSGYPAIGLHFLQALEIGGTSSVFSGTGNGSAGGLVAQFRM